MTCATLDLRRGSIAVDDPDAALSDFLAAFGGCRQVDSPNLFTLRVRTGTVPAVTPSGAGAEQSEPNGIVQLFWRGPSVRTILVPSEALLQTGPRSEAMLTLAAGCTCAARDSLAMIALEEAIHASGQALVHCAALRPNGAAGLVLIHAASGTGKTTTALALAGHGFGLASDDATVIGLDDTAGFAAWGLPRALNLHRKTAALLDWLHSALPHPWPDQDEIALPLDRLPPPARREEATLPVLALIELRRNLEGGLHRVSGADALTALIADNIGVSATGLWPVQQGRLDLLVALAGQVPCYVLEVGPGSSGLQAAISTMKAAF